ncbi:MAG: hypothetical protein NZM11_12995 [Anaerolineales bacterium]|nr:hypothetical protein [Anaerolineales bacterium]
MSPHVWSRPPGRTRRTRGRRNRHITTVDADGVALAAIQGLYQVVQEKDAEIANLKSPASRRVWRRWSAGRAQAVQCLT